MLKDIWRRWSWCFCNFGYSIPYHRIQEDLEKNIEKLCFGNNWKSHLCSLVSQLFRLITVVVLGWRHCLNGHESEQTVGESEGQGSQGCWNLGSQRVDTTGVTEQQQNLTYHLFGCSKINKYFLKREKSQLTFMLELHTLASNHREGIQYQWKYIVRINRLYGIYNKGFAYFLLFVSFVLPILHISESCNTHITYMYTGLTM